MMRVRPIDLIKLFKAKRRGAHVSLHDLVRWRRSRQLEQEPLIRVEIKQEVILLWPRWDFRDAQSLGNIGGVFNNFEFGLVQHRRLLTRRDHTKLRRTWSEKFLDQSFPDGVTPNFTVPLELRAGSDKAENDDLSLSLAAGPTWKSLQDLREIIGRVRLRHLPSGRSGYEYFL